MSIDSVDFDGPDFNGPDFNGSDFSAPDNDSLVQNNATPSSAANVQDALSAGAAVITAAQSLFSSPIKFLSAAFGEASASAPRTFYIGMDGDNDNAGTRDQPFASIEAIANDLRAGDTVYYLEGTYQNASYKAMVDDGHGTLVRDIWKEDRDAVIRLNDVNGTEDAPITISAEPGAKVVLQYDGAGAIVARGSSHLIFEGFEIEGPSTTVTKEDAAAAQYLYRIATSEDAEGNPVYEYFYRDPTEVLTEKISDIIDGYAETIDQSGSGKPVLFNAPAISLPNGSTHITIQNNIIHDSAAHAVSGHGGNDYISVIGNTAYNNNWYTSNGTHAISFKNLDSSDDNDGVKILIQDNHLYDNYNLMISWVTTKLAVKRHVDEGKSIHIQSALDNPDGSNYDWDHGQILIIGNMIERAGNAGITLNDVRGATVTGNMVVDGAFGNSVLALDTVQDSSFYGFFTAQGLEAGAAITAGGLRITTSVDNVVQGNFFSFSDTGAFAVDASAGTISDTTNFTDNVYSGGAGTRIRSEGELPGALTAGFTETEADFHIGTRAVNIINGGDGVDYMFGGQGNDTLNGGAGHDVLVGGIGIDAMNGGDGDDDVYLDSTDDFAAVFGGAGYDTLFISDDMAAPHNITANGFEALVVQNTLGQAVRSTEFDALGRLETRYDVTDTQSYETLSVRYNTDGAIERVINNADNGRRVTTDYDPGGVAEYALSIFTEDLADEGFWASVLDLRNDGGARYSLVNSYDNGVVVDIEFDVENDDAFFRKVVNTDTQDVLNYQTATFLQNAALQTYNLDVLGDDDVRAITEFDLDGVEVWASQRIRIDEGDNFSWGTIVEQRTSTNALLFVSQTNEGSYDTATDYDLSGLEVWARRTVYTDDEDLYSWDTLTFLYDDAGVVYDTVTVADA